MKVTLSELLGAAAAEAAIAQLEKERDALNRKLDMLRRQPAAKGPDSRSRLVAAPKAPRREAARKRKPHRYRGPVNLTAQVRRVLSQAEKPLSLAQLRKNVNGRRMTRSARATVASAVLRLVQKGQAQRIGNVRNHLYIGIHKKETAK